MKPIRIAFLLVSIMLLQSCGLKFWYNRLDWVVSWQADDYVELSSEQEDRLEALVREKLQWHRTTQLPRYVTLIKQLESEIGTEKIAENYDYYQSTLIDFYRTAAKELVPEVVAQMSDLDDEQVQELMQNINDTANKRLQKYKKTKPAKRTKNSRESVTDGVEEWTGRLSKNQKALIKQWITEMQSTSELRFNYGNQWRVAMDYALAERKTSEGQKKMIQLMLNPGELQSPELQSRYAYNKELEKSYILQLHQSMTKKQKKKLLRKLKSYREDFQDLIEDD
ncbi:DUF6279 family lipoprotein [Kangiella sp. HZ709]|uniref:DUF6279 family lipoprotein n=1 Tax=Kangiella sp. HZ709 TaxID=2666328 RepID=UPI0012AF83AA|nr:DUF6279 family lipoprotein [Kangiella sp. HZ709]MRX27270.1 hypothetical protein [Kangiella sp. HZ709]